MYQEQREEKGDSTAYWKKMWRAGIPCREGNPALLPRTDISQGCTRLCCHFALLKRHSSLWSIFSFGLILPLSCLARQTPGWALGFLRDDPVLGWETAEVKWLRWLHGFQWGSPTSSAVWAKSLQVAFHHVKTANLLKEWNKKFYPHRKSWAEVCLAASDFSQAW